VIVHNYTDLAELRMPENRTTWTNRRQSVAYVGGITSQRGIREMVEAMALLPAPLEATLELAGNQIPEEIRAEELYEHAGWRRVRHHGLMDRGSTLQLLNGVRAGLVCLHPKPNHLHSIPVKIFEYMGAGLPIIASDFRDWRAMLGDYKCAIFVDPFDPRAIAQAIEFLLTHPSDAEEMGIRGRTAVIERYNWGSEAKKLVNLYSGLVDNICVE
jgi:glycosyltransferase involved in cell wall biosynthesis